MKPINNTCFFNFYHNGDIFHSKEYIKDIISSMPGMKFYYAHRSHANVLSDVDAEYVQLPNIEHDVKLAVSDDTFFINTWIGSYFTEKNDENALEFNGECTMRFLHSMYKRIYNDLNEAFKFDKLKLKNIEYYYPSIDFSKYFIDNIDIWLANNKQRKILISNGKCYSGQCSYNELMKEIVDPLAEKHKDITFICTHKFSNQLPNIQFTNDIIQQVVGSDLNEIAYLSTFCDLIVGRNSGPFCFCTTKQNILNPNKTLYSFGDRETDLFYHGLELPCKMLHDKFVSTDEIVKSIDKIIGELK